MNQFTVTPKASGRLEIACTNCGTSMEVSGSPLGARLMENWPGLHKCPKQESK